MPGVFSVFDEFVMSVPRDITSRVENGSDHSGVDLSET
jgi:hypothetical protein